ncbi:MAG: type I restriction enzyme HsdR N-terminal domain-containing protein [Mucilaginibacter polytrichastri]|nr:type I restriction enzyme HsdR N-terminal domain-containing protein [Mucilaginibacter polytrichastri]
MQLPALNLPPYPIKLVQKGDALYVFDALRKKQLLCTPEEWVRQHVLHFLMGEKGYPKALIQSEGGLTFNAMARRHDILAFNRRGEKLLLVECKAPNIRIDQAVLDQASRYNQVHRAPLLMVSNGLQHLFCEVDYVSATYRFLEDLPDFPG